MTDHIAVTVARVQLRAVVAAFRGQGATIAPLIETIIDTHAPHAGKEGYLTKEEVEQVREIKRAFDGIEKHIETFLSNG